MRALSRIVIASAAAALLVCAADIPPHGVRATGKIRAVHSQTILAPRKRSADLQQAQADL